MGIMLRIGGPVRKLSGLFLVALVALSASCGRRKSGTQAPAPPAPEAGDLHPPGESGTAEKPMTSTHSGATKGKTINVRAGETFEVRLLCETANAGWEGGSPQGGVLQLLGNEFKPTEGAREKAFGTYCFRYKALKEGSTRLRMMLLTPGGPGVTARLATGIVSRHDVNVVVSAAESGHGEEK